MRRALAIFLVACLWLAVDMAVHADGMLGSVGRVGSVGSPSAGGGSTPGGGFAVTTEADDPLATESSSIIVTENAP